jgi:hypothetical protein
MTSRIKTHAFIFALVAWIDSTPLLIDSIDLTPPLIDSIDFFSATKSLATQSQQEKNHVANEIILSTDATVNGLVSFATTACGKVVEEVRVLLSVSVGVSVGCFCWLFLFVAVFVCCCSFH